MLPAWRVCLCLLLAILPLLWSDGGEDIDCPPLTLSIRPWVSTYKDLLQMFPKKCIESTLEQHGLSDIYENWKYQESIGSQCAKQTSGDDPADLVVPPESLFLADDGVDKFAAYRFVTSEEEEEGCLPSTRSDPMIMICLGSTYRNVERECLDDAAAKASLGHLVLYMKDDYDQPDMRDIGPIKRILEHENITRVFINNPALINDKVSAFPIGVKTYIHWPQHLDGREARMDNRSTLLECRGIGNNPWQGRGTKINQLINNGFQDCGAYLEHHDYIEAMLNAKFTAAPAGRGIQTHRFYEAMMAGSIPLVDEYSAIREHYHLYIDLPVLLVSDWSKITPEYLEAQWERIQEKAKHEEYDMRRIWLPFWLAQLVNTTRIDG